VSLATHTDCLELSVNTLTDCARAGLQELRAYEDDFLASMYTVILNSSYVIGLGSSAVSQFIAAAIGARLRIGECSCVVCAHVSFYVVTSVR
jgi:hypothetical protein